MVASEIKPGARVVQERWSRRNPMKFIGDFAGTVVRVTPTGRASIRWDEGGKSAVEPDYLRAE